MERPHWYDGHIPPRAQTQGATDMLNTLWDIGLEYTHADEIYNDINENLERIKNIGGRGTKRNHSELGNSSDDSSWDGPSSSNSDHSPSSSSSDSSSAPMVRGHDDQRIGALRLQGTGDNVRSSSDEVPVIPPPRTLSKIHPDYFTISLPYILKTQSGSVANFSGASRKPWAVIRLNSVYDPVRDYRQFALDAEGTALTEPTITANTQPQGRDLWAARFKFYRVLKTMIRLEFFSTRTIDQTVANADPFEETYVVGYELIDSDGQLSDTCDMFQITKNAKRQYLGPAQGNLGNLTAGTQQKGVQRISHTAMEYTYVPESWDGHVQEEGSESRWTPVGENPSIEHDMAVRVMNLPNTTPNNSHPGQIGVIMKISYEVQFREAVDSLFKTRLTTTATDPDPTI